MSIQATSMGGGASWHINSMQKRPKPPDMTKDQLTQLEQKMKADGKDTSNLDKIIQNFDQLDTTKDGKVSMDEVKSGASQFGIQVPDGPPHGEGGAHGTFGQKPPPQNFGPPPGLISNDSNDSSDETSSSNSANSLLKKMLQSFLQSDPSVLGQTIFSNVNVAA